LSDFNKIRFIVQFFEKYSTIRFYENPPVAAELSMQTDGRTDLQT